MDKQGYRDKQLSRLLESFHTNWDAWNIRKVRSAAAICSHRGSARTVTLLSPTGAPGACAGPRTVLCLGALLSPFPFCGVPWGSSERERVANSCVVPAAGVRGGVG